MLKMNRSHPSLISYKKPLTIISYKELSETFSLPLVNNCNTLSQDVHKKQNVEILIYIKFNFICAIKLQQEAQNSCSIYFRKCEVFSEK